MNNETKRGEMTPPIPPILRQKYYQDASLFAPENMLREARRQKNISDGQIPAICLLDPDGDILKNLRATDRATLNAYWACYHTELYEFEHEGIQFGIIACAVGSSFAVLLAEQLFVSGCDLLISVTSSGQIAESHSPPFFVLIDRAYRDEGTSYHYLPPADYVHLDPDLRDVVIPTLAELPLPIHVGSTWTTDAPFRETPSAIEYARSEGIFAVEMEAAALYAFAQARQKSVVCLAHVTNQMATIEGDFEKGEADGSADALTVVSAVARGWIDRCDS